MLPGAKVTAPTITGCSATYCKCFRMIRVNVGETLLLRRYSTFLQLLSFLPQSFTLKLASFVKVLPCEDRLDAHSATKRRHHR